MGYAEFACRAEIFVSTDVGERINYSVGATFEHENTTVVHPHPHVLHPVYFDVAYSVVEQWHTALTSSLVVVEVEAIKSRQPVPGGYPYISVSVLFNVRHGI